MTPSSPERDPTDERRTTPVDPDLDDTDVRHRAGVAAGGPFAPVPRRRWPRIRWASAAAVFVGGFVGGLLRYAVGIAWPTPGDAFPWAVFVVNTGGAFILAVLLGLVLEGLRPSTYLRSAVGTGFCGALTTFSSVTTAVDQLVADEHPTLAVGYLAASLFAGLAAAGGGVITARSVVATRAIGEE